MTTESGSAVEGALHRLKIGFIGLGDMGAAMAHNLIDRNWAVTLYARRAQTLETFAGRPVTIAQTPADVGLACDILCLCVVDAKQIDEILFGPSGAASAMAPGKIVIVHSTISPDDCRDLKARLASLQIEFVDAPVTGAAARGRNGTLTIAVGASEDAIARCRALFEDQGTNVAHLGPVGSGQIAKLINNGLFIIQVSLVDEMKRVGAQMGLDAAMVLDVINTGTASSWASGFHAKSGRNGQDLFAAYETTYPGGVIEIVRKDIRLLVEQLDRSGLNDTRIRGLAENAVAHMPPG